MFDVQAGFSSGKHNDLGDGIPHLRPMNVSRSGEIVLDNLKYVPNVDARRITRGDILFNNTNSADLVGKTALFELDGAWAFSNHMTRLRAPPGIVPAFVAYQFLLLWQDGYFREQRTQHVNQASISGRKLADTPIVVAPTQDQKDVVAELDRIFERMSKAQAAVERANAALDELGKAILVEAAAGKLVENECELTAKLGHQFESGSELLAKIAADALELSERDMPPGSKARQNAVNRRSGLMNVEGLPQLPPGWAWARIDQVGEITLGRKREPKHHSGPNMRPYLRVANVFEDRLDLSDVLEMNFTPDEYEVYSLRPGDILLNEGQSPELVGRPAMFRNELPGVCFQMTLLRFRAFSGISPTFALIVFRSYLHLGRFKKAARWSTNIAHLSTWRFAEMEFPVPPLAEQERIVEEVEARLRAVSDLRARLASISERISDARHAALSRAFRGRLVPPAATTNAKEMLNENLAARDNDLPLVGEKVKKMRRASRRSPAQRSLYEILSENGPLQPDALFKESGISEEMIEDFFSELKLEVESLRIRQNVGANGGITLSLTREG